MDITKEQLILSPDFVRQNTQGRSQDFSKLAAKQKNKTKQN